MKKIGVLLCIAIPIQAMFVRTGTVGRQRTLQSMRLLKDRRIPSKKTMLNNELIKHNVPPRKNIATHVKQPRIEQSNTPSNWSWGTLLAGFGLGWLWYNAEEKEKIIQQEKDALLRRCRRRYTDPLYEFSQFIEKHGDGAIAEQLFKQMITDDSILSNMLSQVYETRIIPSSTVPFIKRQYYVLACNYKGAYILEILMSNDAQSKKEFTDWAIRDMEMLCQDAESDAFFRALLRNNPEAINGLVKKAQGHVEQLIETTIGKDLLDNNLIIHSVDLARERAIPLVNQSKNFDLKTFNTCMATIKDDPIIEGMIYKRYREDDLSSLLKKIVYQQYCQQCTKDDLSHASVSLKSLVSNINSFASSKLLNSYILSDKGLSHMVMEALKKEDQYKDDYYVFYHGQPSILGFQQRLFSWLVTKNDNTIIPVVYPIPQTKEEERAEEALLNHKRSMSYHSGEQRDYALYAVVDLFSNITLRLAVTNSSAGRMPSITIEQACKNAHQEKVYTLFKKDLQELENDYNKLHQKGQLLQFRVKKDTLDDFVFIAKDGISQGVKKEGNFADLRSILDTFRNNPEKISNSAFSVGISIGSHLSNPKSGIQCSIINSVNPEEWAAYEKKEKNLKNKIDHYLKTEKKVKILSWDSHTLMH